jgi:hypothetical protein
MVAQSTKLLSFERRGSGVQNVHIVATPLLLRKQDFALAVGPRCTTIAGRKTAAALFLNVRKTQGLTQENISTHKNAERL